MPHTNYDIDLSLTKVTIAVHNAQLIPDLIKTLDQIAHWNIDIFPSHVDYKSRKDIIAMAKYALDEYYRELSE